MYFIRELAYYCNAYYNLSSRTHRKYTGIFITLIRCQRAPHAYSTMTIHPISTISLGQTSKTMDFTSCTWTLINILKIIMYSSHFASTSTKITFAQVLLPQRSTNIPCSQFVGTGHPPKTQEGEGHRGSGRALTYLNHI
jgi:hypothetical protein